MEKNYLIFYLNLLVGGRGGLPKMWNTWWGCVF